MVCPRILLLKIAANTMYCATERGVVATGAALRRRLGGAARATDGATAAARHRAVRRPGAVRGAAASVRAH